MRYAGSCECPVPAGPKAGAGAVVVTDANGLKGFRERVHFVPNRIIKEAILRSERLSNVSVQARWAYLGLILIADDFGRLEASSRLLRVSIFPHDDIIGEREFARWLDDLCAVDALLRYSVDGKLYIQIQRWKNTPRASASKFPPPPRGGNLGKDETICAPVRAAAPVTVTETVFETVTESETVTETKGASPQTSDAALPVRGRVTQPASASDSGSDSGSVEAAGGKALDLGDKGVEVRSAWGKLCAALVAKNDDKAMQCFADCIVGTLKPGVGTTKDRHDAIALGRKLVKGDGGMELRERMLFAVNEAKSVVETGGGYGAWRNRMSKRFGPWSVKRSAGASAK